MALAFRFIPFLASNGTEYELKIEFDTKHRSRVSEIVRLVEDERGRITAEPGDDSWDGLMEMTHALRVVIVSWAVDSTN